MSPIAIAAIIMLVLLFLNVPVFASHTCFINRICSDFNLGSSVCMVLTSCKCCIHSGTGTG